MISKSKTATNQPSINNTSDIDNERTMPSFSLFRKSTKTRGAKAKKVQITTSSDNSHSGSLLHDDMAIHRRSSSVECSLTHSLTEFKSRNLGKLIATEDTPVAMASHKVEIVVPKASMKANVTEKINQFSTEKMVQSQRRLAKLYGRDKETQILRQQLDLLTNSDQHRALIELSGLSGEGKTALALQLREAAERKGCFFVLGKFDLASAGQPYSGIKTALAQLIGEKLLKGLSPARLSELQDEIKSKMTWEIALLTKLLPELALLLGEKKSVREAMKSGKQGISERFGGSTKHLTTSSWKESKMQSTDSAHEKRKGKDDGFASAVGSSGADRLQFALRKLINIITGFSPLIFVCDDVQWADIDSINLLRGWITDEGNPHLLTIWIYRRNMVGSDHFVSKSIRQIQKAQDERSITMCKIEIGELDQNSVNEMISDILDVEPSKTEELTRTLNHKTLGNVFFVRQYLQSLAQDGLLTYQVASTSWEWNEEDIRQGCSATESVADLMKEKLMRSPAARSLLPLAACIGAVFNTHVLLKVLCGLKRTKEQDILDIFSRALGDDLEDLSTDDGLHSLGQIEKEGLIEAVGASSFAFIHDKVIEGALGIVDSNMLDDLKFGMGWLLLQEIEDLDEYIGEDAVFLLVNLLNSRLEMLPATQYVVVSELNRIAGDKAFLSAAYSRSAVYYEAAIKLLPEGHWEDLYETSLHLYMFAAESEMSLAHYDKMETYVNEILQLDCMLLDKLPAHWIMMGAHWNKSELLQTLHLSEQVLGQLGSHFPKSAVQMRTVAAVASMKLNIKKWRPDALSELPVSTDPVHEAIQHIHDMHLKTIMCVQPEAFPLAIITACKHILENGLTRHSATSLAWLGLVIVNGHNDFQWAKDHMEFTQSLLKRLPNRRIEATVMMINGLWVSHWTSPIHSSINTLTANYSKGMELCDLSSAFWCAHFYHEASLYAGKSLSLLEKDAETYCKQMIDYGMIKHAECIQSIWQLLLNLRGHSENTTVLTGIAHDEAAVLNTVLEQTKDWHHLGHVQKDRLFAMVIFGEFAQGAKLGMEAIGLICSALAGQHSTLMSRFAVGLCCFEMARTTKKRKYVTAANQSLKAIKSFFEKGNPNAQHYLLFLKAEKAAYGGKFEKAVSLYERTVVLSGRSGYSHDCALANERLASFFLRQGDKASAKVRFQDSLMLYDEWGATKKVEHMRSKMTSLFDD